MSESLCPVCKKTARPRSENASAPFCSARCKTVDLGKWLNEEYKVPAEEESLSAEGGEGEGN